MKVTVQTFVHQLCESGNNGLIMAVNMLESCELRANPVKRSFLREFLEECAEQCAKDWMAQCQKDCGKCLNGECSEPCNKCRDSALNKINCIAIVKLVAAGHGPRAKSYLRPCKQPLRPEDDAHAVSNVVKTETFHGFYLNPEYKRRAQLPEIIHMKPSSGRLTDYRRKLTRIVSRSGWCRQDAKLGGPQTASANCWLTTDRFGSDGNFPDYGEDSATRARDELGLECKAGACLVQLKFQGAELRSLPGLEVARPSFCDLGNTRFRVGQRSPVADRYAQAGWGATVHMGKLAAGKSTDFTGVPERVTTPLPLSSISKVDVQCLGRVSTTCSASGEAFRSWVLGQRTKASLEHEILQLIEEQDHAED